MENIKLLLQKIEEINKIISDKQELDITNKDVVKAYRHLVEAEMLLSSMKIKKEKQNNE